jgi:hypothetical protein
VLLKKNVDFIAICLPVGIFFHPEGMRISFNFRKENEHFYFSTNEKITAGSALI